MKISKFLLAIFLPCAMLTSCEYALDVTPKDKITGEESFNDASALEMFTDPLYNNLLDKSPFDEQSDQLVEKTLSTIMQAGSRRTVPTSGGGWSWTDLRRINTLLGNTDKCDDAAAVAKYSAVARFFRAFFYFEKVKRFGDVPWIDRELFSNDPALYAPRDSRELIMTKMIEDIDFAIENLPAKKNESVAPFRLTKGAALALKAQFCLFEGTYRKYHEISYPEHDFKYYLQQAADAAETLIDSKEYKLYSTGKPEADYQNLFVSEVANPDEYILAISFQAAIDGNQHNANAYTLVATQGRPGFTRKFVNSYLMKDGSRFTDRNGWQTMGFNEEIVDRDPRLTQSIRGLGYHRIGQTTILPVDLELTVTGYHPIKFVQDPTLNGGQIDRNDRSTADLPVYRYAEVLLNYAEAKAELGTITQDDLDKSVNLIRERAGMPGILLSAANSNVDPYLASAETGYPNVSGQNKGVILEIRRERGIELVMEGFRINDLFRWKCGKCLDQDIYGIYFNGPGEYDLSGDGNTNLILVAAGAAKPNAAAGVLVYELDKDIFLSEGNRGYYDYHKGVQSERNGFNENRDYLYPIPSDEIALNPNLAPNNPGWQ
ncbi:MAG: RagB/SusD family nutrient uptake outer membrane protein [Bacteroides sp.]|nr:RagB/SusD family nutrient uptake outer membrane protein [Bacteroides sp.]